MITSTIKDFFSDKEDWTRTVIREELKKTSGPVLDIGCGAGDDVKWCEANNIEAFGIEPSKTMLNIAKSNVRLPEKILAGSFEKIPFQDNYFELIMGRFSLHYLNNFTKAYSEIFRVLKKGGTLLLTVSHPIFDAFNISKYKKELVEVKLYEGKVTVKFPPHDLSDYFSKNFLNMFELSEIMESPSIDAVNPDQIPETLYIKAIKK